ncbi:uncharacterized protein LOC103314425 [Tribolium castaneum]|uniref:Uncharacterized protein n=1 Tax=Tribolium castaneum TaxID=7070 RepID=A0A139WB03_TRICA|nr:PREDICTED: uncharacterized protein LOC103314425 [Tribolium castaneum]KYB25090.1 hypothetical protein TcasGA2_TC031376 [Tribolium castaneum]|eukprot:XP_015839536.1 PREDICTED: uncharacterized protein LOC103314425 [Tribolium castaneum]
MKFSTICLSILLTATLTTCEYPRPKYRGPPPFPKPPPFQQFAKKWQQHPPRPPIRPRPIPVHMPKHHKIQMGAASVNRPVAVPVRNFWKNTQTTFRTPVESYNHKHFMTSAPVFPKKVFQSSPAIAVAQDYDLQIQSNNIAPIQTIKQIGEKGPIHTIPAPNLSLADKPKVVEEVKQHVQRQQQQLGMEEIKHQRQPEATSYVQVQKSHSYQVTEAPELAKQTLFKNYYENQNPYQNPTELYQLLNAYSQGATIAVPVVQDPQDYLQYSSLFPQQPQNYVEQVAPEHVAMDKSSFEEAKKEPSSQVTATYNLEPDVSESIIQSQYVQNYFDTKPKSNVEPDAKPSEKNNTIPEGFYVSLPNKEAAEKLASLQAAGKLNSNLMQIGTRGQEPIYVQEESQEADEDNYDEYPQEDLAQEEANQSGEESFGHRLQPKT